MPALGTFLWYRFVGCCELALRITRASVERVPATARTLLDQLAFLALRTLHPDEVLLHVLAIGISRARDELAIATMPQQHVASALWTLLIEWNIRHFLALIQTPGGFAVRIPCARHELAEASAFQHHGAAAVLAILFLRRLL